MKQFGITLVFIVPLIWPLVAKAQPLDGVINGFTQAYADVTIGLSEAGRLSEILTQEGVYVEEGQVLLSLDKRQEELSVKRQSFLVRQTNEIEYARKRVAILKEQFLSAERLFKDANALSEEEYQSKHLEYLQAQSELAVLVTNKKLEKIEQELAEEKLARRVLRAPVSGVVARLAKKVGESVQAHEELVRLVDTKRGRFVGNTEFQLGRQLVVGQMVCLKVSGMDRAIPARVDFLSPTVDVASGLMEVKAEFTNSMSEINLGLAADLLLNANTCSQS
ncbi:MAG: HlyD family efflux transporter periplasmic adaptor subunit [Methylocystaceae bacterium]|nr:HlyD family efflux transporter periplasmic adaptor subunit [Methylocystaceae bacterium]